MSAPLRFKNKSEGYTFINISSVRSNGGYTLIEILVVLSIIGILFGIGYANFRDFSRRQVKVNAVKGLQADLRLAQEMALSGQKPSSESNCIGANVLDGYLFKVNSSSQYEIRASCSGGIVSTVKTIDLPPGISVSAPVPNPIMFKVLGAGNNIDPAVSADFVVSQDGSSETTAVKVSSGGQIQTAPGPTAGPTPTITATPTSTPTGTACSSVAPPVVNVTQTCSADKTTLTLVGNWNSIANVLTYRFKICFESNCATTPIPKNVVVNAPTTTSSWSGTPGTYYVKVRIESSSSCTGTGNFADVLVNNSCP